MIRPALACVLIVLSTAQRFNGVGNNQEFCQCRDFDPCLEREKQRYEQCWLRTCPAQAFDQRHQDLIQCYADVPDNEARLTDCVQQKTSRVCQGSNNVGRAKRQTSPPDLSNYYNVQYDQTQRQQEQQQRGSSSDSGLKQLMAMMQAGAEQWRDYAGCMNTCMNSSSSSSAQQDKSLREQMPKNPHERCAEQLNCRLIVPTFEQVQTAIASCSAELNIDWRAEAVQKCRCVEAIGASWISCNTLELLAAQVDNETINELVSNILAAVAGSQRR